MQMLYLCHRSKWRAGINGVCIRDSVTCISLSFGVHLNDILNKNATGIVPELLLGTDDCYDNNKHSTNTNDIFYINDYILLTQNCTKCTWKDICIKSNISKILQYLVRDNILRIQLAWRQWYNTVVVWILSLQTMVLEYFH